ncbi:hypothetical protein [Pseudooceanicola sp. LIPI14-2-Ac024]|uniref:hypothetical protein n=1 Tax=Pseudooceanicola sp. LIPI14-2-Ac024 TaxID=3344875 RepID=UPI0035D02559
MNIFKSPNAPFAVVILTGALGWYIATLQSTLGDRLSLVYEITNGEDGNLVLKLDNISREKVFSGVFNIVCDRNEDDEPCFDTAKKANAQYQVVEPFNLSNEITLTTSPEANVVQVNAWIPPSASVKIEFAPSHPKSNYNFQYFPEADDQSSTMPEFYEAGFQSGVIRHFDTMLIVTFAACLAGLILFAIIQLWMLVFSKKEQEDDAPILYDVTVRHTLVADEPAGDSPDGRG